MVVIPDPKTHSSVAKNQHLIPRCYLKAWKHNSGKDPKVWVYDKSAKYCKLNPEKSDWSLKSTSIREIMTKNGFHDIKAGSPYMPDEALREIFDDILQFNITHDGMKLDSPKLLNQYYYDFDNWDIKDSSGIEFTEEGRGLLRKYFQQSRWTYVETEWAHEYESKWEQFISCVERKVRNLLAQKRKENTVVDITHDELNKLVKYYMIYNWRSDAGNEIFNNIFDSLPYMDILNEEIIPESERIYEDYVTQYDRFKHASITKAYVDYLKYDSGKMKKIEDAFMQKMAPIFLLTDDNNSFITSNIPSFISNRPDGPEENLFVATPTMLIIYGKGNNRSFRVLQLSKEEVLNYNRYIATYGNKLIVKDQDFDVSQLFTY